MSRMRGNVTRLVKKQGYGFILAEDGCEVYFEQKGLKGIEMQGISVGQQVEFRVQYGARAQAIDISPVTTRRNLW